MLLECSNFAVSGPSLPPDFDELPAAIRAELNADTDRDVLTRMRHLARKKRIQEPEITDEEMADYLALAEDFTNFEQWLRAHRSRVDAPVRTNAAWLAAIVTILGLLTMTLVLGIAITV
jgi:hypothetical protein